MKREKTGGRQRGTPNKLTADVRQRIKTIIDSEYSDEQMRAAIASLDPEKRMNLFCKLVEYLIPKLRASDLTVDLDIDRLPDEEIERIVSLITKQYDKKK